MSKHWKPGRRTVELQPSRIRRDPPPAPAAARTRVRTYSPEMEMWGGVSGIVLFAAAIALLAIGIGAATIFHYDAAADAARADRFGQCYDGGANCVFDGGAIRVGGEKMQIAGVDAPSISSAQCSGERSQGIHAALILADMLNSGKVTVGKTSRDPYGRDVRTVLLNGEDVGEKLINAELVREYHGDRYNWCD